MELIKLLIKLRNRTYPFFEYGMSFFPRVALLEGIVIIPNERRIRGRDDSTLRVRPDSCGALEVSWKKIVGAVGN